MRVRVRVRNGVRVRVSGVGLGLGLGSSCLRPVSSIAASMAAKKETPGCNPWGDIGEI